MTQRRGSCGTESGWVLHRRRGERPCEDCRQARYAARRLRRAVAAGKLRLDVECPRCGLTFASEQGVRVHLGQVHGGRCEVCGASTGGSGRRTCRRCAGELSMRLDAAPLLRALDAAGLSAAQAGRLYDARFGLAPSTGERYLNRLRARGSITLADADRWCCLLGMTIYDLWEEARWTA